MEEENKELPVLVRGDLGAQIILIFVQGGPGETAIDFGRSDYPNWKNTLEKDMVIAYYDQRGLNKKVHKIAPTKINYQQYSKDLIKISEVLKEKYHAKIYLMGHSYGGGFVYHCLSEIADTPNPISGEIILNTPITTGYSPERNTYYRPLYLKNIAQEFIEKGTEVQKWQEAYDWMEKTDSLYNSESMGIWNGYVDSAFSPIKRKTSVGMITKVLFSKPYHPFNYFKRKDNKLVSDLIWEDAKNINFFMRLAKIKHPVLVITGRYDDIADPKRLKNLKSYLKIRKWFFFPKQGINRL